MFLSFYIKGFFKKIVKAVITEPYSQDNLDYRYLYEKSKNILIR